MSWDRKQIFLNLKTNKISRSGIVVFLPTFSFSKCEIFTSTLIEVVVAQIFSSSFFFFFHLYIDPHQLDTRTVDRCKQANKFIHLIGISSFISRSLFIMLSNSWIWLKFILSVCLYFFFSKRSCSWVLRNPIIYYLRPNSYFLFSIVNGNPSWWFRSRPYYLFSIVKSHKYLILPCYQFLILPFLIKWAHF